METVEIHDDETHEVHTVRRADGKRLSSRPQRADEIRSGNWQHPQRCDENGRPFVDAAGQPLPPRVVRLAANTPQAYRSLCERKRLQGFTPVGGTPVERTIVEVVEVE